MNAIARTRNPEAMTAAATPLVTVITSLSSNDVLFGRGAPANFNEGNRRFRRLIQEHTEKYRNTTNRQMKDLIARVIVQTIEDRNGHFVRKVESLVEADTLGVPQGSSAWVLVDKDTVVTKVKQALRGTDRWKTDPNSPEDDFQVVAAAPPEQESSEDSSQRWCATGASRTAASQESSRSSLVNLMSGSNISVGNDSFFAPGRGASSRTITTLRPGHEQEAATLLQGCTTNDHLPLLSLPTLQEMINNSSSRNFLSSGPDERTVAADVSRLLLSTIRGQDAALFANNGFASSATLTASNNNYANASMAAFNPALVVDHQQSMRPPFGVAGATLAAEATRFNDHVVLLHPQHQQNSSGPQSCSWRPAPSSWTPFGNVAFHENHDLGFVPPFLSRRTSHPHDSSNISAALGQQSTRRLSRNSFEDDAIAMSGSRSPGDQESSTNMACTLLDCSMLAVMCNYGMPIKICSERPWAAISMISFVEWGRFATKVKEACVQGGCEGVHTMGDTTVSHLSAALLRLSSTQQQQETLQRIDFLVNSPNAMATSTLELVDRLAAFSAIGLTGEVDRTSEDPALQEIETNLKTWFVTELAIYKRLIAPEVITESAETAERNGATVLARHEGQRDPTGSVATTLDVRMASAMFLRIAYETFRLLVSI